MATFWVGDRAGRRLGPIGFDVLKELIGTGRLLGLCRVSTDGKEWRPLQDFPEISALFAERESADRAKNDEAEAERIVREIGALKSKPVHEVFGLKPTDSIDAYRASFFALVRRFYPERVPRHAQPALRHAYGEMFHFLSRVMAQVEELKTPPQKTAPDYKPKDFIGWERRTDNRVYCELECNLRNALKLFSEHKLVNISNGGFFVAASRTPALGEQVDVTLKFEGEPPRTITGQATVVWENQVEDPRTPRGFGCRFLKLSEEDKKFIRELVRKATAAGDTVA